MVSVKMSSILLLLQSFLSCSKFRSPLSSLHRSFSHSQPTSFSRSVGVRAHSYDICLQLQAADSCVVENRHVYNFLRFCTGTVRNVQLTASCLNEPLNTNTLYLNLCFEHYSFLLSLNNKISECHHTTSVYLLHSLNDKHTRSLYISHSLSPTYLHKHSSRNFSSFFPIFDFTSSPV